MSKNEKSEIRQLPVAELDVVSGGVVSHGNCKNVSITLGNILITAGVCPDGSTWSSVNTLRTPR